jgi:hypothetical protein
MQFIVGLLSGWAAWIVIEVPVYTWGPTEHILKGAFWLAIMINVIWVCSWDCPAGWAWGHHGGREHKFTRVGGGGQPGS